MCVCVCVTLVISDSQLSLGLTGAEKNCFLPDANYVCVCVCVGLECVRVKERRSKR